MLVRVPAKPADSTGGVRPLRDEVCDVYDTCRTQR